MDDILKEIEKAADDIQIPASLDPNNVKKKLKERKLSEVSNYMDNKKSGNYSEPPLFKDEIRVT